MRAKEFLQKYSISDQDIVESSQDKSYRYTSDEQNTNFSENFNDGKIKGRSRPGRVKRAGASCKGSVTDLRDRARKYGGERGKMYHWCANMKAGKKKTK